MEQSDATCSTLSSCVNDRDQTNANQERELRAVADRLGCEIVKVFKDHGISGANPHFSQC